jgi:hypothetical protein
MSDACTIICPSKNYIAILEMAEATARYAVHVNGPREAWQSLAIISEGSTLEITASVQVRPGDHFSKLILGMHNFFTRIETRWSEEKRKVLSTISRANMLIGVTADPAFAEEDGHYDCIFEIAKRIDGVIFTGSAMLNAQGKKLLDIDGESDMS